MPDVLAQPPLVVLDVAALALGDLAVRRRVLTLLLDDLLLVLEPLLLLRRDLTFLDAALDALLLRRLLLLDRLGERRDAGGEYAGKR
ncbi:MAG TPA: hypothetical protein VKU61_02620 [Candidatus Binatia bacterium]|nr:hypothetical protein [Candidatus Binatia bacterium]